MLGGADGRQFQMRGRDQVKRVVRFKRNMVAYSGLLSCDQQKHSPKIVHLFGALPVLNALLGPSVRGEPPLALAKVESSEFYN